MGVMHTTGPAAARLRAALDQISKAKCSVGWFDTAKYSDGTPVAYVAAIQEFGSPEQGIPARAFMRPTAAAQQMAWRGVAQKWARRTIRGEVSAIALMDRIGIQAAGDISKAITKLTSPPLKPDTVKARLRGRDQGNYVKLTVAKPLVDSGHMLATLTHVVEEA